ncbi:MAG: MFS transporter [Pseudomonadota bacterium]
MLDGARHTIATGLGTRVFFGWVMVAAAGLGIFVSGPGQSHTFSVFVGPISAELGISNTEIASAYAVATVAAAFLLPLMGKQVDRLGPRRALIYISFGLGLACLFFGAAANFLWLVIGFGLLRFLGQGSMMLGSANLVAHWFTAKRGIAMSLMALGFGLSMAVHPKLGHWLIEIMGWREAWVVLGLTTWLLMLPVLVLIVHDKPEDLGLRPDNAAPVAETANDTPVLSGPTKAEALRHSSFFILCACWFAFSSLVTTLHYHQFNILTGQGIDADWATNAFTISAIAMVCAMPLVGRACDKIRTRIVLAIGLCVQAGSLIAVTQVTSTPSLIAYAVIFGLNNAFTMTLFGYLWPRYFGRKHLGQIQGTGQMVAVIGASLGPLPVSYAFDVLGDPRMTLMALAAFPVLMAAIAVLALRTHPATTGTEHLE